VRLAAPRQPHPRVSVRTTTREGAPTPPPSKPFLDGYRAHHDALPEAGFATAAVYSTTLCTIPLHIIKIVRHDCKPPPLGLKRRGRSPSHGGGQRVRLHTHCLQHDIGTCLNQTSGTWRPFLLSRLACSSPLRVSVFKPVDLHRSTRSKVEGGDRHDLEPEGPREDTRHNIYTGSGSQSSYPTSCWSSIAPCAWVLFPRGIVDVWLGTRSSFI
jgi:hypothetical protein